MVSLFNFLNFQYFQPYNGQRPPSPPRHLREVFDSKARADEFHAYLLELDKANGKFTLQTYLNFALKCDELRNPSQGHSKAQILASMSSEFFSNSNRGKRLALTNEVTREECKKFLENKPDGKNIPQHLWNAEEEAQSHLSDHYQNFLKKKYQDRKNSLTACIL